MAICSKENTLAVIKGSTNEVQLFQGAEVPPLKGEETRLFARKEELPAIEGDFAGLKSDCLLSPLYGCPVEQDPARVKPFDAIEGGGDGIAPNFDVVVSEVEDLSSEDK